jgi:phage-related tail protein
MRRPSKKLAVAIAAAGIVAIGGGAALAYWTQSGTGTGSGSTGTTASITVNQTSTVSGLYPGSTAQALSGNFDNLNANAVTISSVTAVVSSVTGAGTDTTKPACTTLDYTIAGTAAGSVVPVGSGVGSWTGLTLQLVDGAGNQDNCKGATAHITYTANA